MKHFIYPWLVLDEAGEISISSEEVYAVRHLPEGMPAQEKEDPTGPVTVIHLRPGLALPIPDKEKKLYQAICKILNPAKLT